MTREHLIEALGGIDSKDLQDNFHWTPSRMSGMHCAIFLERGEHKLAICGERHYTTFGISGTQSLRSVHTLADFTSMEQITEAIGTLYDNWDMEPNTQL
jgi:hypothetical protein